MKYLNSLLQHDENPPDALTLWCWHRGVVWCGLVWVRYRCVVRYWGEGDAASDRGFGSGDQVECGDRGWGGLSALHYLTAWVCRVRDDLAVGWWDNSIHGWASTEENTEMTVKTWNKRPKTVAQNL